MTQGVLPFKYEEEKTQTGMTALAGLPVYLDLAKVIGLSKSIGKYLKVRENSQGWTDPQMILSLVLLNLAGGDCVDDLKILEADEGFCQILRKSETHGLKRKTRRALNMDATLAETMKKTALYCYKGFKSYQPLNTWWHEQGIILHTEFRDGNVPAGFEQLRVFNIVKMLRNTDILPNGNVLKNNNFCQVWMVENSFSFPFRQWK